MFAFIRIQPAKMRRRCCGVVGGAGPEESSRADLWMDPPHQGARDALHSRNFSPISVPEPLSVRLANHLTQGHIRTFGIELAIACSAHLYALMFRCP